MRGPAPLVALLLVAGCGGSGSGPDAPYASQCGPVASDAGLPNTLIASISYPATLKKACSPYHLASPVTVQATLTIEPGVEIVACQGGCRSRINVGTQGIILAEGTETEPIVFTSSYRDNPLGPPGGQWTGILFRDAPIGSKLRHVIIEYAGGPYTGMGGDEFNQYEFPVEGSLLVDSATELEVVDVWIRDSRGYAIAATTSDEWDDAEPPRRLFGLFDRITMSNTASGVWMPVNQGGNLGGDLCFVERNADGTCPDTPPPAELRMHLHLDSPFQRTPESVTESAVWRRYDIPYLAEVVDVTNNATLTIADGVELRMSGIGGITVGVNAPDGVTATLVAVGSAPGSIKITAENPAQPWKGLYIWDKADDGFTHIENVELSYGGRQSPHISQAPALIGIYDANPLIVGNHVHHSEGAGIHWNCTADPAGLPPDPSTNTSDDATIACAAAIGSGIAENWGCACPQGCADRCVNP